MNDITTSISSAKAIAIPKWDLRFLDLAAQIATWSKDPSSQLGAIAVDENRTVIAQGYNGFPKGVRDFPERYADKELKYKLIVHAEQNCIYNAARRGAALENSTLYISGLPVCHECCKGVIQAGFKRVVMRHKPMTEKWRESFEISKLMLNESGIEWKCYETKGVSSGNESSRQADARDEAKRVLQALGIVGDYTGNFPSIFHQYDPSTGRSIFKVGRLEVSEDCMRILRKDFGFR